MYVLMNKDENRVMLNGDLLSGDLMYTVRIEAPLFFKSKLKAFCKSFLSTDLVTIKVKVIDLGLDESFLLSRNYYFEWLRLKGTDTFIKVWKDTVSDPPDYSSKFFIKDNRVMLKGIGDYQLSDFELLDFQ